MAAVLPQAKEEMLRSATYQGWSTVTVRRGPHLNTRNQKKIAKLGRISATEGSAPENAKSKENRKTRTDISYGGVRT
jgi:hypothetical protein